MLSVRRANLVLKRSSYSMNEDAKNIFQGKKDWFKGITVDSRREPCDVNTFATKLSASLKYWKSAKVRGVWFKVALEHSEWVPILAKHEFWFHHAHKEAVMMCRWLPGNTLICNIPDFSHTLLSAGGLVTDSQGRMLVVKERLRTITSWKLPGGYVEKKEDLSDGVVREVFEETGIRTKFQSLLGFMHSHTAQFGCSGIYFITHLTPEDENQPIVKCEREIEDCCWMKIEDYLHHPEVHGLSKLLVKKFMSIKDSQIMMKCKKYPHPMFQDQTVSIFSLTDDTATKSRL